MRLRGGGSKGFALRTALDIPRYEIVAEGQRRLRPRLLDEPLHEYISVDREVRTVDPSIPG